MTCLNNNMDSLMKHHIVVEKILLNWFGVKLFSIIRWLGVKGFEYCMSQLKILESAN